VKILLLQTGSAPPTSLHDYPRLFGDALQVPDLHLADARLSEFPGGDWAGVIELNQLGLTDPLFQHFPPQFTVQQSHADVVERVTGLWEAEAAIKQQFLDKIRPTPNAPACLKNFAQIVAAG